MRKTCRERFGPTASGTCPTCEKYIQVNLGKHVALYHLAVMALSGPLVHGLEGDVARLCGSHEKGVRYSRFREGREFGTMVSALDSHS